MKNKLLLTLLFIAFACVDTRAQSTTIVSQGTWTRSGSASSSGNGFSFSVRNNKPIGIKITDISSLHFGNGSGSAQYTMWYTTDPAAVAATNVSPSTPTWTNFGQTPTISPPDGVQPFFTNISLVVPANTTMRIVMGFPYTSPTTFLCTGVTHTGGPVFSSNGVDLMSGSNAISNGLRGYGTPPNLTSNYNWLGSITFEPEAIPCDDTVDNALILGPEKVCPRKPYNLKVGLQNGIIMSGLTYQWQYSADGYAWSNFTGVPNVNNGGEIRDSITAPRWYRCRITCQATNESFLTAPHKVDIYPFYYCYCDNETADDDGQNIGNFTIINSNQLDTIYDKSKLTTGTGVPVYNNDNSDKNYTGYHDSLGWPCLYRDTNYIYHVSQIHKDASFKQGVAQGYIDYNRDGIYDPNNERIFVAALDGTGNPPQIIKSSHTVPSTAEVGPTGLRIIISEDTIKGGPCGPISGAGEVEDYIVEICYRPCNGPINAGNVVFTDTSMCSGYEYTIFDTTYEQKRSGFNRSWQISGDNISWLNIPNSGNKDTLQRLFAGQPLYYRYRTICGPTHDTTYSDPALINLKPAYKCYCYSKATGGVGVDTSDIGGVTMASYNFNAGGPHLLNAAAKKPRTDFTDATPIELFTDSLYKFELFHTMPVAEHGDAKITLFMDFNNNHQYDIPDERVYTGFTTIGSHTLVDNVVVPINAITDVPTGMRVIVNNDVGPNIPSDEACGAYQSGETEDYVLIFRKQWAAGISDHKVLTGFNVHPNPTNGKFFVQFSTNADVSEVNIKVSNITGQSILQQNFTHEGGMFYQELDMTGQPSGVYFVELHTDNGNTLTKKLIVK